MTSSFFKLTVRPPGTAAANCIEVSQSDLIQTLSTVLPLSDRGSIERRGLLDNTSVADVGKWESAAPGRLVLHLQGNAGQPGSHLNTAVPFLGIPGFAGIANRCFVRSFVPVC